MPKVTIGLPVYNSSQTLSLAVQSILGQSFTDWELIICDDASTDDSLEIANGIDDPRVRVVRNASNLGLSACLNRIASLAEAPLIARMDSDDLIHPDRLRRQVDMFAKHRDLEVVSTDAFVVNNNNQVLGGRRRGEVPSTTSGILWRNGPIHASIMATKTWCERFPYVHRLHRGEDLDLWARAMPSTVHRHLSDRLYFIREEPHVNVAKYCRTISAHSEVFRSFAGQQGVTHGFAAALLLRSYLRIGAYRAAGALGMQSRIAARRLESLSQDEMLEAQSVIDRLVKEAGSLSEVSLAIR